jgi:hypothetical protein
VLRWAVRQPRFWFAVGCWLLAVVLTFADHRMGWSAFVALMTAMLAALSVRLRWDERHPGEQETRAAVKQRSEVDKILWRYERQAAARRRAAGGGTPGDTAGDDTARR